MASNNEVEHLFIVGAGFSQYASLPLTSGFTKALLDVEHLKLSEQNVRLVNLLRQFVHATFDHATKSSPDFWPYLEDIFTCIDLSANTGHHLGPDYSPAELRTVRRALIVRIIRMLQHRYQMGEKTGGPRWKTLETFFETMRPDDSAFLSMNWDTVVEQGIEVAHSISHFDYGCDAQPAIFSNGGIKRIKPVGSPGLRILKPHGSSNWLYCDSCRDLFWFSPAQTERIATQLFKKSDWDVVRRKTGSAGKGGGGNHFCPNCGAQSLGTRFATFSYRKALEFPMHGNTWRTAERLLKSARTWVFIGYSLPPADYEFKLLLKRVQLSRKKAPKIVLVTGGSSDFASQTQQGYLKFFGSSLQYPGANVFLDGLEDAISGLQKVKVLSK